MLVTDRTASNGNPIVVSIKRQGRDSSGRVATTLVTVYPRDRIKQTVLSAQESNNLRYIRGSRRGWSCPAYVPVSQLIYAAFRSNAKGLFPPNDECRRLGL